MPREIRPLDQIPMINSEVLEKLAPYIRTTSEGRSVDFRTPFFKDYTVEAVQEIFRPIIEKASQTDPAFADWEAANAEKTSPMSVMLPFAERRPQVEEYFTDPGGDVTDDEISRACEIVWQFLGLDQVAGRMRMQSLDTAVENLPSTTNWGLPYYVKGKVIGENGEVVEDNRSKYLKLAHEMAQDLNHEGWEVPCLLFWRGDLAKGPTPKQRVVWGYPHAISIIESAIYTPLTRYFQEHSIPGFAAWRTFNDTKEAVLAGMAACAEKGKLIQAWDASAFDQHLCKRLIQGVNRNIVQKLFQMGERPLIERACTYSMQCGIVTPEGVFLGRDFNRPSGSGGTNFNDSLENLVAGVVVQLRRGLTDEEILSLMQEFTEVNGDDKACAREEGFEPSEESAIYASALGMKVNDSKADLSVDRTNYLKREYKLGYEYAWYSEWRFVMKLIHYEHARPAGWSDYADSIRCIAMLANIWGQPGAEEIAELCIKDDKYGLGTRLPGGLSELFNRASRQASQGLDELLGVKAWAGEYSNLRFNTIDEFSDQPVVQWLAEKIVNNNRWDSVGDRSNTEASQG